MSDVQVHVDLPGGETVYAGRLSQLEDRFGTVKRISFTYASSYLAHPGRYDLCPELTLSSSPIRLRSDRMLFGAFADSAPDRWGRHLLALEARERAIANGGLPQPMTDLDYLTAVSDDVRHGALRFSDSADPAAAKLSPSRGLVSVLSIRDIVRAAHRVHDGASDTTDAHLLFQTGTAMGGARPKATVQLDDGRLALAKLPFQDDRWNVELWEEITLQLARRAGITVPTSRLYPISEDQSILVTERFDRTKEGRRIGYLSMDSFLEIGIEEEITYEDVAQELLASSPVAGDGEELFRRVVFTVLINNIDDHMRNHGVLRSGSGWKLAPAFDMNPHALGVLPATPVSRRGSAIDRDIRVLVDSADAYGIAGDRAKVIVREVEAATGAWREVAHGYGQDDEDIAFMERAFDGPNRARARAFQAVGRSGPSASGSQDPHAVWVEPHVRGGKAVQGHYRARRAGRG